MELSFLLKKPSNLSWSFNETNKLFFSILKFEYFISFSFKKFLKELLLIEFVLYQWFSINFRSKYNHLANLNLNLLFINQNIVFILKIKNRKTEINTNIK